MNLVTLRENFRNMSGRHDLVNDDMSDNGADFYINFACRQLDREVMMNKSHATRMSLEAAGTWLVQYQYARSVKEVWVASSTARWQLEKRDLGDILAAYYGSPPADIENGTPLYYSPFISRNIPEDISSATLTTYSAFVATIEPDGYEYNALIFNVPCDVQLLVEVKGLFYSIELSDDTDTNYWSDQHAMLLLRTAIRATYVGSGNTPMNKLFDEELKKDLFKIEFDFVDEVLTEVDQMEG